MLQKIKNKILISIGIAGLIYLAFTLYADYNQVAEAFKTFNWILFPVLLILSLINYYLRFLKWDYYLKIINVSVKKIDSFSIFMSGLIMSITPGKFGELMKAYMVKQINGTPVSKTAPIIFVERITDFVSLVFIALIGAFVFDYGRIIVSIVGIFFLICIIIISNRKIALSIIKLLEEVSFLKKHFQHIINAYESSYLLLRPYPLFLMSILSLFSWFFECLGYFIILDNFHINITMLWASFAYAFATIVGAITMLPGGLGATEGSLTFLLTEKGASLDVAVASTFIVRAVTLWFAVIVGIISVFFYQKRFGKITIQENNI